MRKRDWLFLLGFTLIVFASTVPVRRTVTGEWLTLFELIKYRIIFLWENIDFIMSL